MKGGFYFGKIKLPIFQIYLYFHNAPPSFFCVTDFKYTFLFSTHYHISNTLYIFPYVPFSYTLIIHKFPCQSSCKAAHSYHTLRGEEDNYISNKRHFCGTISNNIMNNSPPHKERAKEQMFSLTQIIAPILGTGNRFNLTAL